jgi:NTE family protein
MKKIFFLLCFFISILPQLKAQKVGIVLSGGGSRGITHIGVIKALEDNNIPIDYVTGTSMGAIVGSLYAMGNSPDEIIEILKSDDFKRWSTGEMDPKYVYYYHNADPKPRILDLSIRLDDIESLNLKPNFLPTNFVSPRQMNFAFVPLFAQASAVSKCNFDSLFIPFRCVASDTYRKEAVVFRNGVLGDAVRASMTFPFMFKPITIDNRLLFDGGIFNNFPVDVMRSDFNPDFIVGSVVVNNPSKPDEHDLVMQMENLIMNKTNYSIDEKDGVLLNFKLENVYMFDFSKVDELVKIGYNEVIKHLDVIKARVPQRISLDSVNAKRKAFRNRFPPLIFQNIYIDGVDSLQKQYIKSVFHSKNNTFNLNEFKEGYFKLISDDKISEVMPHASYNSSSGLFDLQLKVKAQNRLKVLIGGNVSSSTSNQAFLGLTYQNHNQYAQSANVDVHFGKMYNGLALGTRIDLPTFKNGYLKSSLVLHKFDYYDGNRLFYQDYRTANFTQYEGYGKLSFGFPLTMKGRMEFGMGYRVLADYYRMDSVVNNTLYENERSLFSLGSMFAKLESYSLNNVMYPTKGFHHSTSLQLIGGDEAFTSTKHPEQNVSGLMDLWLLYRLKMNHYFPINHRVTLGTYGELTISNRNLLQNYIVSVIEAPAFHPTPHSQTAFNDAFCANQFAAVGLKPIYNITDVLHLRCETYWFVPYKTFKRGDNNSVYYSKPFVSSQFMAQTALVLNLKLVSASMFVNYYSTPANNWNFGLNIGFLMFNSKFTE